MSTPPPPGLIEGTGLPPAFIERLERIAGPDRLPGCLQAFSGDGVTSFRVNRLLSEPARVVDELVAAGIEPISVPWRDDAYTVVPEDRRPLTETAACREGRLYIQNLSSMIPPEVLGPEPGNWVLDLAAAPGGKTLQLAALMGNQGRISAVEPVRSRFYRLQRNLTLGGVTCAQLYRRDGAGVGRSCPEWFDRVLLDAPCTAEGRIRASDPASFGHWHRRRIKEMSRLQRRLLFSGLQALKIGGALVYATCTLAPEENEMVIHRALERYGEALSVEPLDLGLANSLPGLTSWGNRRLNASLSGTVRILPDGAMEGFYVARLRKMGRPDDL